VYLLYLDEPGKSGPRDFTQPYYTLGGLVVHKDQWVAMETDLNSRIDRLVPPPRAFNWELHMADLYHGKGHFKRMPRTTRYGLVEAVFDVLDTHRPVLLMVAIHKRRHLERYGSRAEPVEALAYRFMLERFNHHVGRQSDRIGVVVHDEQKELETPTRKAHLRYRREGTDWAKIEHVIETPLFTPSHSSRMLQIIDVATYWVGRTATAGEQGRAREGYWRRVEMHLDGYPDYLGRGLKIFPEK
jgi:hypothetical protein